MEVGRYIYIYLMEVQLYSYGRKQGTPEKIQGIYRKIYRLNF